MQIIAVVNEKGGTGKTTTAVSLSAALGSLGRRILLVDLDGQASASRWFGVEEDDRLADALAAGGGLEPIENVAPGVSLAPATGKVDSVARDLRPSQSAQLRKVLRQVQDRYDLVIMDCPPSLNNRLIGNALLAATHVLVPVETSIMALDGLQILLTTLEDISDAFEHQIVLAGVLACRYDARTRLSRLVLEELRRSLPSKVFGTVIRENVRMRECPASGQSILEFAPASHAAEDYLALAQEMIDHPDAWQQPAYWETTHADNIEDEAQRCSVESLRSRAAETVRAGAVRTGAPKPAEPGEPTETPGEPQDTTPAQREPAETCTCEAPEAVRADVPAEPADAAEPAECEPAEAKPPAIDRWTGGVLPSRVFETPETTAPVASEPAGPAQTPDDATELDYRPGPPPDMSDLDSCLGRLADAKARLSATEDEAEAQAGCADDPPQPEPPLESAETQDARPTWRDSDSTPPASDAPHEPAEPAETIPQATEATENDSDVQEGLAEEVEPTDPAEEIEPAETDPTAVGAEAFPALRELLSQMGRAPEPAGAGATGGQDSEDES